MSADQATLAIAQGWIAPGRKSSWAEAPSGRILQDSRIERLQQLLAAGAARRFSIDVDKAPIRRPGLILQLVIAAVIGDGLYAVALALRERLEEGAILRLSIGPAPGGDFERHILRIEAWLRHRDAWLRRSGRRWRPAPHSRAERPALALMARTDRTEAPRRRQEPARRAPEPGAPNRTAAAMRVTRLRAGDRRRSAVPSPKGGGGSVSPNGGSSVRAGGWSTPCAKTGHAERSVTAASARIGPEKPLRLLTLDILPHCSPLPRASCAKSRTGLA